MKYRKLDRRAPHKGRKQIRNVSDFYEDMREIARKAYPRNPFIPLPDLRPIYVAGAVGAVATGYISQVLGYDLLYNDISSIQDPVYRSVAVVAMAINRIADNVSTRSFVKEFDDKFFEYGLNNTFSEGNPTMPSHPTLKELNKRVIPIDIGALALSFFMPGLGYMFGVLTPHIYYNNSIIAVYIRVAKKVGDMVKAGLNDGMNDEEIRIMLSELETMDKDELRRYLESYTIS